MSTVASVEPSLTTITSSMSRFFVSALRTSAMVFSSLNAAMMADIPNPFTSNACRGQILQPADHSTGPGLGTEDRVLQKFRLL